MMELSFIWQGRDNLFETGCAFHSKISKTWCAKSAVSLLGAQKVGAQMRTLAHYTLPPLLQKLGLQTQKY